MQGLHLCADLRGCEPRLPAMTQVDALRALCVDAVSVVGLSPVAERFHAFAPAHAEEPSGITGVVLLAESHVAIHTWPEQGGVTLDVYVCNLGQDNSAKAQALMQRLVDAFAPTQSRVQTLRRGVA
jgi:S-adenosylmethionine decarboxylase proenzyme